MRAWLVSNPDKRKTMRGMPRFMNSWLARPENGKDDDDGMNEFRASCRRVELEMKAQEAQWKS